jgi:hypothetical protein
VEAIADNSESIQDVAVVRDIGVPQALGAMSFSDPWSKGDIQRKIGPCFGGSKHFGSEVGKFTCMCDRNCQKRGRGRDVM